MQCERFRCIDVGLSWFKIFVVIGAYKSLVGGNLFVNDGQSLSSPSETILLHYLKL